MSSPYSCVRCSRALDVESASGLCRTCLRTLGDQVETSPDSLSVNQLAPTAPMSELIDQTRSYDRLHKLNFPTPVPMARPVPLPPAPPGYELIRELGIGGMGMVFLARDHTTERLVALKFLQRPGSQSAYDRFLVELRALTRLNHPNIIRVLGHDFLRADPYFVTEYVPGGSLSKKLEANGPLDPTEAARLIATAARAVHAAHTAHVVHRDLKPSNILLVAGGDLRVCDFGLAKRTDRDDQLTANTGALGTPAYMAPEQARNGPVDRRADVYGLGATLYHLVTGQPPFAGPHDVAVQRVLNDPPVPPRKLRRGIPSELEAIILKCLEKDPARRYSTAEELAVDLDRFLTGDRPQAPLLTWRRRAVALLRRHRRTLAWAVVSLALVALGGVLAVQPWRGPPLDPETAYLAHVRRELAAGRPVTLIEGAAPVYHRWRVETGEIKPLEEGDSTFAFLANGYGFVELFPDPGIDRYRLSVELKHFQSAGAIRQPPVPSLHKVGLYFGYEELPMANGGRVITFGGIDFSDFQPPYAPRPEIFYRDHVLCQRPLDSIFSEGFMVYGARRDRVESLPGPWRTVVVEVTPEKIDALYQGMRYAGHDANGIRARTATLNQWMQQHNLGTVPGEWSPRRPFGVWVLGSWVAVRNFTVTPLPNP